MRRFALPLAFWLAKPYIIGEIIDELIQLEQPSPIECENALACIIELGAFPLCADEVLINNLCHLLKSY